MGTDELIYLDISKDDKYDLKRDDLHVKNINSFLGIIEKISKETFMPIIGGKLKLSDIENRLKFVQTKLLLIVLL